MIKIYTLLFSTAFFFTLFASQVFAAQHNRNELPKIGTAGNSVLSVDKERLIGNALMRELRRQRNVLNDPVLIEYINTLGNHMVKHANDVNYSFKFFFVRNDEINAFAFFGGHIGVHTGLVSASSNESELASVVAHEISHVTQRHLARKIEAQSRTQPLSAAGLISGVLLSIVNPSVGIAALTTSLAASQQASINYTRSNELEADRVGIELLANSGFDPHGAPSFFGKLAERFRYNSKPPAILLTHPLPDSRISDARIRAQNYPKKLLKPSLQFELAKARIVSRYQKTPEDSVNFYLGQLKNKRYVLKEAALYGLAIAYFESKQYQKSYNILQELHSNDDKNLFYIDVLSDVGIATKKYEETLTLLTRLNNIMPNNQVVTLNYANVLLAANKLETSEQILQDFLLTSSDNYIAYELLTAVYKKQNNRAMLHATNAEVYALLGSYPNAVDELQTAYGYVGDSPLTKKRFRARILQFQEQQDRLKRL